MPGRKRANPRRLNAVSDAKRHEFFQFVPSATTAVDCADSANLSVEESCPPPLTEVGNSDQDGETAAQADLHKKCKSDSILPGTTREPFPATALRHVVNLLHSKMTGKDAVRILAAKSEPASTGHVPSPVMFGELMLEPKAFCHDFDRLLEAKTSSTVKTSLLSTFDHSTRDTKAYFVKFEDGENVSYLEVAMDYRLQSSEAESAFRNLFRASAKAFLSCDCHGNDSKGDAPVIKLELWAMEKLCEFDDPSEVARNTAVGVHASRLVEALYPEVVADEQERLIQETAVTSSKHLSFVEQMNKFYKDVQVKRGESSSSGGSSLDEQSIPGLTAELRGYQQRGVNWMMEKEMRNDEGAEQPHPLLHMLWKKLPTVEYGLPYTVYFNAHSGKFTTTHFHQPAWPRGGILADEMGLGKTVEVLALVLSHKWTPQQEQQQPTNQQREGDSDELTNQDEAMDVDASIVGVVVEQDMGVANPPEVGVAEPNSEEKEKVSDEVQCICGAMDDRGGAQEFVQCERCLVWQHSTCVGFDSEKDASFICVRCLLKEPLPCGTTLIVSPQSIAQQWMEEINKHTEPGALKTFLYEGIRRYSGYVSPANLASYDVVLVTYETLRNEFYHATSQEVSKNLRYRKRYVCFPSPLPAVLWWRVCLDEAQMVESTHAKAAEMMMKISAVNRWCVTGTPVQRCLLDLHGLVLFLGVEPYKLLPWFQRLVWNPYLKGQESIMISLFSKIMWRSSKTDVAAELQLPHQSEEIHSLRFSSVERYFYLRQKENCVGHLTREVSSLGHDTATLASLLNSTVTRLMHPLHSLRQACCHPSIVRNSYLPFNFSKKNFMTMPALLEKLTKHTKGQTRDDLRRQVAALNGLAGLHILKEEFPTAVEMYRSAMTVWQEHESHDIECDRVQRVHTMENLSHLLAEGHGRDTHTLRDDSLLQGAEELRSEFMKRSRVQVEAAEEAAIVSKKDVEDALQEMHISQARLLGELPQEIMDAEKETQQTASSERVDTLHEPEDAHLVPEVKEGEEGEAEKLTSGSHSNELSQPSEKDHARAQEKAESSGCSTSEGEESGALHGTENSHPSITHSQERTTVHQQRPDIVPSLPWWQSVIHWATEQKISDDLLQHVNAEGADDFYRMFRLRFNGVEGISLKMYSDMDKLKLFRDVVLSGLESLLAPPTPEFIKHVGACHIQRHDLDLDDSYNMGRCNLCLVEDKTLTYAQLLFKSYNLADTCMAQLGDGSQAVSDFEHIIKAMLAFIRHKGVPRQLIKSGQAMLAYFEALKKEYRALRKLWIRVGQYCNIIARSNIGRLQ